MILPCLLAGACAAVAACGDGHADAVATPAAPAHAIPAASESTHAALLRDWPEFGLDPQRSNATNLASGITAANVRNLRRVTVNLPGTVDSSAIYLHGVPVAGATRNVAIVTTTYGRTLAIDADSGRILWTFTPAGYGGVAGSAQITNTTPLADPDRQFVYAASPDGLIHKLAIADGREAGGWPVPVTRDATHEKLGAALNIDGPDLLVATSGYFGDAPPYQGHLLSIDRVSGHIAAIFNTLCANRRVLLVPRNCPASDSAILSRGGAVVEPASGRILIDTGNGPWNGVTNFGDSVLELEPTSLRLRQSFTPTDQQQLNETDTDLGSSAPALVGSGRVIAGGKDGILRVLALGALDGSPPRGGSAPTPRLGGEVQRLSVPGSSQLFTAPAVWHHGGRTAVFVAAAGGTEALALSRGRLLRAWQNGNGGTSPVLVGGLLYVFSPGGGGILVYEPSRRTPIAALPAGDGHWNSPIVVDRHVIEPLGNANDHQTSGQLEIFSVR
jgi:outer membrane protein assembly factor BamB